MTARSAIVILVAALFTVPDARAQADADTTGRTITIPAPENGIIYIRTGPPGGVRIRSVRGQDGPAAVGASEQAVDSPVVDLERLARVFERQGLNLYAERVQRDGEVYLVLRNADRGAVADTLSEQEAQRLAETLGAPGEQAAPDVQPAADDPAGLSDEPRADEVGDGPSRDTTLVRRVERSMLDAGMFRSLQVHFEFDRSALLPSSEPTIDAVAEVMRRHPNLEIAVTGHTDAVGTQAYNEELSHRRAASVVRALSTRGVSSDRLDAVGYGEDRPILTNETPTGRALNRRVEFEVTSGIDAEIGR